MYFTNIKNVECTLAVIVNASFEFDFSPGLATVLKVTFNLLQ